MRTAHTTVGIALVLALAFSLALPASAPAQKYGGTLVILSQEAPPSLSLHEEASATVNFALMPIYSNLALFDPLVKVERLETIIPEAAAGWRWEAGNTRLVFRLREGVKWHDGRPFTAADVKYTWDLVRGVSPQKMKLNPRKVWWDNIEAVTNEGDREVAFRLKRPQPAMLALLASGASPVYPRHVPASELRTTAMGTGPFRLKAYPKDREIALERNREYFVKERPYLDGIRVVFVRERSSRIAALVSRQADLWSQGVTEPIKKQLASAAPGLVFDAYSSNVSRNVLMNLKKPPFNDVRLRQAVALALDQRALIKSVFQGVGVIGGAMLPRPWGVWGLPPELLARVPGIGPSAEEKEKARRLMHALGYGPGQPLKVKLTTRNIVSYTDVAAWMIAELRHIWIEAELETVESGNWFGKIVRRDFLFALNLTAVAVDDPDVNFFENYGCGSQRNYTDYCDREMEQRFVAQSVEFDQGQRMELVHGIDLRLQEQGARPMLTYTVAAAVYWPYVKNFVMHQSLYNPYRFQEVWLDK